MKILKDLEKYFLDIIQNRHTNKLSTFIKGMLYVPSLGFRWIVALRNWAFDKKYLPIGTHPGPLVISIGNIVAGGTGKTPFSILLGKTLAEFPISILSRGYRSHVERLSFPVVISTGHGPLYPPSYCGDEPFLIAKHLPKATVIVGKNRNAAAEIASKTGTKIIILDDGFQHRWIPRDFEIAIINGFDPFGQEYFLPRGLLRDSPHSLRRAQLLVLNHMQSEQHYQEIKDKLVPYSSAPLVGTKVKITGLFDSQKEIALSSIQDKKVGIFCGIGQPESFYNTVNSHCKIIATKYLRDHDFFETYHFAVFSKHCEEIGADFILCTEKDFVKLPQNMKCSIPIYYMQMELQIVAGENHWNEFISNIRSSCTEAAK